MPITWTQAQMDELQAAIASGVSTVKYSGPPAREVTYHSLDQMRSLLSEMAGSVAAASGSSYRLGATRKGL